LNTVATAFDSGKRRSRFPRVLRIGFVAGCVLTVVPAAYFAVMSYTQQVNVFFPKRKPIALPLGSSGIPRVRAISFRASDSVSHGWYAPSLNRAAVVLVHGAGGDRASLVYEARALAGAGFGVLSFDLPGHGESEGEIHWSEAERSALRAALSFVERQADVDPARIGAFGFSLGGYVAAQVAAHDPRIAALVLVGTPSDPVAQVRFQHRRLGFLTQWPALFALRRGGMQLDVRARDVVHRVAPRPLLVVTGTADGTVPRTMADELYRAAGEPKELYVVEGAQHGDYAAVAPGAYESRLVQFYARFLGALGAT
jgi:pimeloyl-ACP methyl ester carboxylesterase